MVTIEELNKLYDMLTSSDMEMKTLGVAMASERFNVTFNSLMNTRDRASELVALIAGKAYKLGMLAGEQYEKDRQKYRTGEEDDRDVQI